MEFTKLAAMGAGMRGNGSPIARLQKLTPAQRQLIARAWPTLALASLAVALLPFRKAVRLGSVALGSRGAEPKDICWAVEAAARRLPLRAKCIEKGLAAQRLLRSAGHDATLHYGARHNAEKDRLEAHVWVTLNGEAIVGGDEASGFAEVARYS